MATTTTSVRSAAPLITSPTVRSRSQKRSTARSRLGVAVASGTRTPSTRAVRSTSDAKVSPTTSSSVWSADGAAGGPDKATSRAAPPLTSSTDTVTGRNGSGGVCLAEAARAVEAGGGVCFFVLAAVVGGVCLASPTGGAVGAVGTAGGFSTARLRNAPNGMRGAMAGLVRA